PSRIPSLSEQYCHCSPCLSPPGNFALVTTKALTDNKMSPSGTPGDSFANSNSEWREVGGEKLGGRFFPQTSGKMFFPQTSGGNPQDCAASPPSVSPQRRHPSIYGFSRNICKTVGHFISWISLRASFILGDIGDSSKSTS
ncbi:MAG: hypothetical protein AAF063_37955, partial [Cyanobacteria bacterium J06643_5]